MSELNERVGDTENKKETFIEGIDFYFENGLMVLTAHFLKRRGYCCESRCRHCPYPKEETHEL